MNDFKDLEVWRKAHELTLAVYRATVSFPREELFGLTSQLRRAAASIAANIAEGAGRKCDGDFGRFIQVARGSASEVEYHLILARDLGLLSAREFDVLSTKLAVVQRMLTRLVQRVRAEQQAEKSDTKVRRAAAGPDS